VRGSGLDGRWVERRRYSTGEIKKIIHSISLKFLEYVL
jgi:hypothetical protein